MRISWNQRLNLFLRIYLVFSLIFLWFLMNNYLYRNENLSFNRCDLLLQSHRNCVFSSTQLKVALKSIKHLRRSQSTVREIFNYLTITFNKINSIDNQTKDRILSEVSDRKNVIEMELQKVSQTTELKTFKNQILESISNQIMAKIYKLQNPPKHLCHRFAIKVCKVNQNEGFASLMHEILWCFVSAYHNNQTVVLILDMISQYFGSTLNISRKHPSKPLEKWDKVLMPFSTTCDYMDLSVLQLKEGCLPNTVFERKLINQLPKEFGAELIDLVESPNSWFHSRFIGYILRPQPRLQSFINEFKVKNNFKHPIVGIQVRRSDKVTVGEALFYPISDYMIHVKDFYNKLELTDDKIQRRVYVASDDPSVLPELITKYPGYIFIGNTSNSKMASTWATRYSNISLWGVLTDVFLLSETDYIVCTFSSAVCRLSYELMRFKQTDASFQYRSLDVPYHYHHSLTPIRTAFYNHIPKSREQWALTIGDHLHERISSKRKTEWFKQAINGRGWDSYFFASNSTKDFYKLYPIYKVYDDITLV